MSPLLPFHVAAGMIGLLFGFVALGATKGRGVHRRTGIVFVAAMVAMGLSAAVLGNVGGGLLATYMVVTGLTTVRPPSPSLRWIGPAGAALAIALGAVTMWSGLSTVAAGSFVRDGVPVPMILFLGSVVLAAGLADVRLLLRGIVPAGRGRLVRHLWRMCFALFVASGSFFLGQADEIPAQLRVYPVLTFLALLPLLAMGWWVWRLRGARALARLPVTGTILRSGST